MTSLPDHYHVIIDKDLIEPVLVRLAVAVATRSVAAL